MRKIMIFTAIPVLLLAVISFNGCQKKSQQQTLHVDDAPLDRKIGQMQSLGGIKTSSQGTHLLKLENGSTILLRSLMINLDDPKYQNKIVEVQGYLNDAGAQKQIMDVQNIDVIDVVQTQQTVTINWKEYSNPILGFEARYRDDFQIKEGTDFARFSRPVKLSAQSMTQTQIQTQQTEHSILVGIMPRADINMAAPGLRSILDRDVPLASEQVDLGTQEWNGANVVHSKIGVNGLDAYKKVDEKLQKIDFYFKYNDKYYHLGYTGGDDPQNLEDQNIFYDFVNSFRFISRT